MIYLKKFETASAYDTAKDNLILPNVSFITENRKVEYNPSTPRETRVVLTFNVTSTTESTRILSYSYESGFTAIEIDGVEQPSVVDEYTFDTIGEHIVKYTLRDPTSFDNWCFSQCGDIINATIPDSMTSISDGAFWQCQSLTSVTIGNGVTRIGDNTFRNCENLKRVNSDTDGVFNIPNGVTMIDCEAFRYISGVTSVTIPDSVVTMGYRAFRFCPNITTVTIGSGITTIGYESFYQCSAITSVIIEATTPPELTNPTLSDWFPGNYPIYVPSGSVDAYKAAANWSDYASRIQAIP